MSSQITPPAWLLYASKWSARISALCQSRHMDLAAAKLSRGAPP